MDCVGCLPVTRSVDAARVLGTTGHGVRRLLADQILVRLRRGVVVGMCWVERASEDRSLAHELVVRAALLDYPDAVASHESAGLLHRLPLLTAPSFGVLTRSTGAWRGGDIRVRTAPLPQHHVTSVRGVRCTTVGRTVADIARTASFVAATVTGDAALRWHLPRESLMAIVKECSSWVDIGPALDRVAFFDGLSESPLESISRANMHTYGVPRPELQVPLVGASKRVYRVDFYWRDRRLIGEADGAEKYRDPSAVVEEKQREDDLREADFDFVRWNYARMMGQTEETIERIMRKLNG